ncbi:hypothetical protein ACH4D5_15200 [Streptomyces sp. NPDC018029]|uniref:hypothetical protein n=1 Tax=Streptomyces sp. NPDC018029 TaxID=3365032 RepID=UPI0037888DBB
MRALPVRRLATTTLCVTLLLGTAGPAFASQGDVTRDEARTAPRAATPEEIEKRTEAVRQAIEAVAETPGEASDPTAEAVAELRKAVDGLVRATSAEDPPKDVLGGLPQILTGLIGTLTSLLGGTQPKAPTETLPQTPSLTQNPSLPATPALPAV